MSKPACPGSGPQPRDRRVLENPEARAGERRVPVDIRGTTNNLTAVDDTQLYWTDNVFSNDGASYHIWAGPKSGGKAVLIAGGSEPLDGFVVGGGFVFYNNKGVHRVGKDGTGDVELVPPATGFSPRGLLVDGGELFMTEAPARVTKVPIAGGAATTLATGAANDGFALLGANGTFVYVIDTNKPIKRSDGSHAHAVRFNCLLVRTSPRSSRSRPRTFTGRRGASISMPERRTGSSIAFRIERC